MKKLLNRINLNFFFSRCLYRKSQQVQQKHRVGLMGQTQKYTKVNRRPKTGNAVVWVVFEVGQFLTNSDFSFLPSCTETLQNTLPLLSFEVSKTLSHSLSLLGFHFSLNNFHIYPSNLSSFHTHSLLLSLSLSL